jgi:uncharacterized protein YggL (DUF469 family)
MNKRLMKKKSLGKFRETCLSVSFKFIDKIDNVDKYLDDFINFIDEKKLFCEGYVDPTSFEHYIFSAPHRRYIDLTKEEINSIFTYITSDSKIDMKTLEMKIIDANSCIVYKSIYPEE